MWHKLLRRYILEYEILTVHFSKHFFLHFMTNKRFNHILVHYLPLVAVVISVIFTSSNVCLSTHVPGNKVKNENNICALQYYGILLDNIRKQYCGIIGLLLSTSLQVLTKCKLITEQGRNLFQEANFCFSPRKILIECSTEPVMRCCIPFAVFKTCDCLVVVVK